MRMRGREDCACDGMAAAAAANYVKSATWTAVPEPIRSRHAKCLAPWPQSQRNTKHLQLAIAMTMAAHQLLAACPTPAHCCLRAVTTIHHCAIVHSKGNYPRTTRRQRIIWQPGECTRCPLFAHICALQAPACLHRAARACLPAINPSLYPAALAKASHAQVWQPDLLGAGARQAAQPARLSCGPAVHLPLCPQPAAAPAADTALSCVEGRELSARRTRMPPSA